MGPTASKRAAEERRALRPATSGERLSLWQVRHHGSVAQVRELGRRPELVTLPGRATPMWSCGVPRGEGLPTGCSLCCSDSFRRKNKSRAEPEK